MSPQPKISTRAVADEFIAVLEDAIRHLNTLAQIQAISGTTSMQFRAKQTEIIIAKLENYIAIMNDVKS